MHDLGISLPKEDGFSRVKNTYIKSAYYSICDDYGVDADGTWINGDWYEDWIGWGLDKIWYVFGDGRKATKISPPDNLARWIITQYKGFTRKSIDKISRSTRAYM